MRKFFAAALAVPILTAVYAGSLVRRIGPRRLPVALVAIAMAAILSAGAIQPTPASGILPSRPSALLPSEFTTEIQTGESPVAPIVISFPTAMNPASVAQLVRVEPATAVDLAWDPTDTLLTITPRASWSAGAFNTVTVEAGALDATGRPLDHRIRAAFVTRPLTGATIVATSLVGTEAAIATAFRITFTGPVDESTLDVLVTPEVEGSLVPVIGTSEAAPAYDFIPDDPLAPDTDYIVRLGPGMRDLDGAEIEAAAFTIRTAAAPAVVRFRPRNGWADVTWSQKLSVRFTEPMDRASTETVWSAAEGTTTLDGTFAWAEDDTVLVFDPKAVLGYSQKVSMTVGLGALSRAGLPLQAAASATFTTAARSIPTTKTSSGSTGSGSAESIGGSTWAAVEAYYLTLMNCTRTGGSVTSSGTCSSPGGRDVAPLWQDAGITAKVSRPYARKLAVNGSCSHFLGGNPGNRLSAAGYTSYIWAENLGCRSGAPSASVLGTHLFYQSEKSYSGGHYVNLMNAKYDRVGIGVWASGGRVRLVVDFYHPA